VSGAPSAPLGERARRGYARAMEESSGVREGWWSRFRAWRRAQALKAARMERAMDGAWDEAAASGTRSSVQHGGGGAQIASGGS
jgi:hypothetical protein